MKKLDYFLLSIDRESYRFKDWVIHCFSLTDINKDKVKFPYPLQKGHKQYFFTDDNGNEVTLEDTSIKEPAFGFTEAIKLSAGAVLNLSRDVNTNYGKLLINCVALVFPFGNKVEYINEKLTVGTMEEIIVKRLTTDKEYQPEGYVERENPIYVSEYLTFIDAVVSLEGYSQLAVPSATQKTMTVDPSIAKRRDELLKQHKDELHDPAVVAKIDAELIQMDKDWMKGDLGEGFYNKAKHYNVVRKKTHLMVGYEGGMGVQPDTITRSLNEGWDTEKLPAMVNSLREGSYYRGKMTAEGGYATKTVNRLFQNVVLSKEDCGSILGRPTTLTQSTAKQYIGFYYLKNNKAVEITSENVSDLLGKEILVRSPMYCKAPETSFCSICVGKANSEQDSGLAALAADMTSLFLTTAMGKMHGTSLEVHDYDPNIAIT